MTPMTPGPSSGMAQRRRFVTFAPDHAAAWLALAAGLGGGGASVPALERAARLDPGSVEAHYALGLALRRAERLEEALDSQRRAIRAKPDFLPAHMSLGNGLLDGAPTRRRGRGCNGRWRSGWRHRNAGTISATPAKATIPRGRSGPTSARPDSDSGWHARASPTCWTPSVGKARRRISCSTACPGREPMSAPPLSI